MIQETQPAIAFEIYVNGERFCVAGIGGDGVLNTMVDHVAGKGRSDVYMQVGGLISSTGEHVRWGKHYLKMGDEVRVKIVEGPSVDQPKERFIPEQRSGSQNR